MSLGGKCHDQVGAVLQEFHTQAVPKTRTASWTTVGRLSVVRSIRPAMRLKINDLPIPTPARRHSPPLLQIR